MVTPLCGASLRGAAPRLPDRARAVFDAGFEAVALLSPLHAADWDSLAPVLPRNAICCVELFLPYPRAAGHLERPPLRLGFPGRDEKAEAFRYGRETILFAESHSIPAVLVPPVRLAGDLHARYLRSRGRPFSAEHLAALRAARRVDAEPALDAYRSVLSRLLDEADRYGVGIGMQPGGWLDDVPDALEAASCLREFLGAPLSIWLDTLGREVAMETHPSQETWDALEQRLSGLILRDRDEDGEEAPPGRGSLDRKRLRPLLEKAGVWLVDPPSSSLPHSLCESRGWLESLSAGPGGDGFRGFAP